MGAGTPASRGTGRTRWPASSRRPRNSGYPELPLATSITIGIAGGTGAGKTTIAQMLAHKLPPGSVAIVEHDAYYRDRPDLSDAEREAVNYDHPDALDNALLRAHLAELRAGRGVDRPIYDFVTHRRSASTVPIGPHPVIVVEGILLFVDPDLRHMLDIKLFVDTDADIRAFRRIRRDMAERGRSFEDIRRQYYDTVRPMHIRFVEPSRRYADLIIPEGDWGNLDIALDVIVERIRRHVGNQGL